MGSWEASPAYQRLLYNRPVIEALHQLTRADDLQVWHDQIQYKPPQHGGINNWHQDAPYWPILRPLDDPGMPITAWVALDDVDEENGCMSMVPHSHLWGNTIDFLHTLKQFDDMKNAVMTATDKTFTWGQVGVGSFDDTGNWDDFRLRGRKVEKPKAEK